MFQATQLRNDNEDRGQLVAEIRDALLRDGFLVIRRPFNDSSTLNDAIQACKGFFSLPDDHAHKQAVIGLEHPDNLGWMPMFNEPSYEPGTIAHVESYNIVREPPVGDETPSDNVWPDLPGFRESVVEFWDAMSQLSQDLFQVLAEAFNLERDFFTSRCGSHDLSTLRFLHYPTDVRPMPNIRNVGLATHTDFECMTLIVQTQPGLEVENPNGEWIDCPATPDTVIVMLGDMLERWTNGKFKATVHRVRRVNEARLSLLMFCAVDDGVVVEPLLPFISEANPPRFPPVLQIENINNKVDESRQNLEELERGQSATEAS